MSAKTEIVIITGLSGAGKTHAADWFEDHGYYCIDNMPPALIKTFLGLSTFREDRLRKAAFVIDIRSEEFFSELDEAIEFLKQRKDIEFSTLFVEASVPSLIRRYNETRRNHPLTGGKASREVIEREIRLLSDLRSNADHVLDTTNMKVSEFNHQMDKIYMEPGSERQAFSINIISFGFKYGLPQEVDMIFDMRFIPNPYYLDSLRNLTGNNKKVSAYVMKHEITQEFVKRMSDLVLTVAPGFVQEGKNHINIGFGCTGGQHRSVAIANEAARIFHRNGYRVTLEHREL